MIAWAGSHMQITWVMCCDDNCMCVLTLMHTGLCTPRHAPPSINVLASTTTNGWRQPKHGAALGQPQKATTSVFYRRLGYAWGV